MCYPCFHVIASVSSHFLGTPRMSSRIEFSASESVLSHSHCREKLYPLL